MANKNNFKKTLSDLFAGRDNFEVAGDIYGEDKQKDADDSNVDAVMSDQDEASRDIYAKSTYSSYLEDDYIVGMEEDSSKKIGFDEANNNDDQDRNNTDTTKSMDAYADATTIEPNMEEDKYLEEMQTTTVSADTLLTGEINSNGHIEIYGNLNGNVKAKGNIRIYGQITGDISGNSIELVSCKVRGNINAAATVQINHESVVAGNVSAADMVLDGKLKGDVTLLHTILFMENAVLFGNVYAGMISINEGAKLYGEIQIENGNNEALFSEI